MSEKTTSPATPSSVFVDDRQYTVHATKRGGMGRVWLLEDRYPDHSFFSFGSRIAVKTFDFTPKHFPVERELNNWVTLDHRHILQLLKIGRLNYRVAAIMPWRLGTIEDILKATTTLPTHTAIQVAMQTACALQYALTKARLIHLDLKPANILTRSTEPMHTEVSDWGISRIAANISESNWSKRSSTNQLTSFGAGTPLYMSPERFSDKWKLEATADIYSLGMILIEMLSGTLPFRLEHKNPYEEIASGTYVENAAQLLKDCPRKVTNTIMQLVAPRPADRPPSYEAVLRLLKRCA